MTLIQKASTITGKLFRDVRHIKEQITLNYVEHLTNETYLAFSMNKYYLVQNNKVFQLI